MRWQYWVVVAFHLLLVIATYNLYRSLEHRVQDPASIDTSRLHQKELQRQNGFKLPDDDDSTVIRTGTVIKEEPVVTGGNHVDSLAHAPPIPPSLPSSTSLPSPQIGVPGKAAWLMHTMRIATMT